ncbi:hypothetical protein Hanom_Chr01g00028271 [Helianthus anomalus]
MGPMAYWSSGIWFLSSSKWCGFKQWRSQKFFLMVSYFMGTPVYSNPESNFLDRFGSSQVKSHNKSKYHSKSTM